MSMWTSWLPTSRRKSNTNRKKRLDAGRKIRFPASFFMSRKWHKAARVRKTFVLYKTAAEVRAGLACFWRMEKRHETARMHKAFVFWKTAAEVKVGSAHSISEKERACVV